MIVARIFKNPLVDKIDKYREESSSLNTMEEKNIKVI